MQSCAVRVDSIVAGRSFGGGSCGQPAAGVVRGTVYCSEHIHAALEEERQKRAKAKALRGFPQMYEE
jgi:hypothetical protein